METGSHEGIIAHLKQRWDMYYGLHEPWVSAVKPFFQVISREIGNLNFGILWRPSVVAEEAFARWWIAASPGIVNFENDTAIPSLVGSAYGVVLELGPGAGNQLHRLDASKVKHVYGIESNQTFASTLDANIKETGLEGAYTTIIGRVESAEYELEKFGVQPGMIDCVLSIQTLCSVKDVAAVARRLHHLLKPGGELIFWEHQKNEVDFVTRMVQGLWTWVWRPVIGGCKLNQPTREAVLGAADWEVVEFGVDEKPLELMPRVWGRLKKK